MRSEISFDGMDVPFEQFTVSASLGRQLTTRLGLTATAGGLLFGSTEVAGRGGDFEAGFSGSLSLSYLAIYEGERTPFLLGSLSLGALTARAEADGELNRWTGTDMRIGLMAGKTFAGRYVPFVVGRVFAGPVSWRIADDEVTGSDVHKYTAGAGFTMRIPTILDLFAEVLPVGEQSASIGALLRF